MRIENKVAIVTGGGNGLGKLYTEKLLEKGAKVAVFDMSADVASSVEGLRDKFGHSRCMFVQGDVTKKEDFKRCFQEVRKRFGRPHIMINNAGIADSKDYLRMMTVNAVGVMTGSEMALEEMHEDNGGEGGVIINIGSIAGLEVAPGNPGYYASKHAVVGFTKAFGLVNSPDNTGVRVACLCPGFVRTNLTKNLDLLLEEKPSLKEHFEKVGGWTSPETVASALLRLCEDDSLHNVVLKVNTFEEEIVYPEELREVRKL